MARRVGRAGARLLAAALVVVAGGCDEVEPGVALDGGSDGPVVDAIGADGPPDVAQGSACLWEPEAPELTLPEADLRGVLRGSSRNASTTCTRQKSAGGPEAIYRLRVEERMLVDIEVVSELDTVLAIRRTCDDPLTELACNDAPASSDAHLRATLEPGQYFLLVDEADPFGVGGEYQLKLRATPPPAPVTCAIAQPLFDGTRLAAEELDLAREFAPCTEAEARPALFYRATIPGGERITVRAAAVAGDRPWTPVLRLFTTCPAAASPGGPGNLCLAGDEPSPEGPRVLRHVNNGASEEQVLLSVSASGPVRDARFNLEVRIAEPMQNVTCATARPLSDGLVLRNQDLSEGQPGTGTPCDGLTPWLFYRATLFPRQSVRLAVATPFGDLRPFRVVFRVRESCESACDWMRYIDLVDYTNNSAAPRTVLLEATSLDSVGLIPFDLRADMPLPAGEFAVRAARRLTTSEAGASATFEVQLTSPVVEPVDIPLSSSDPAEGAVSPPSLRFTSENWQTPRTVTVTGVDDASKDGPRSYAVAVGPPVSVDPRFASLPAQRVSLVNGDDEPGFSIEGPATLVTSESGAEASFRVVLNRAPSATVRLPLSSSDEREGDVSPGELLFEPGDWQQPRTVTVTGVNDEAPDGSQPFRVVIGAAISGDPAYQGIDPEDLPARNADDDFERVAPQRVSGDWSCQSSPSGPGRRIAVDEAANLYVVMACQAPPGDPDAGASSTADARPAGPTTLVAVSEDGGRTFRAPVDTGLPTNYPVAVAAGSPGLVVVAAGGPEGVSLARSEDGGITWQRTLQVRQGSFPRLAAAGKRVVLETGPASLLWVSDDGALTFTGVRTPFPITQGFAELGVDGDGDIWIVNHDGNGYRFRTSSDGGATFEPGPVFSYGSGSLSFAAGPNLVYQLEGNRLVVGAREGSTESGQVAEVPEPYYHPHAIAVDARDNAVVLSPVYGKVELRRLAAGETTLSPARSLTASYGPTAGVALSDNATAVVLVQGTSIAVAVETWP